MSAVRLDWARLFRIACSLIRQVNSEQLIIDSWSFGGGTTMMLQIGHRESRDVDIFLPDAQLLPFLDPKLHDFEFDIWPSDYGGDGTGFLKLAFEGTLSEEPKYFGRPLVRDFDCSDILCPQRDVDEPVASAQVEQCLPVREKSISYRCQWRPTTSSRRLQDRAMSGQVRGNEGPRQSGHPLLATGYAAQVNFSTSASQSGHDTSCAKPAPSPYSFD
ncbi:nucleotidyl transferase AbiEii/AbiGii toxin family protein [Bradyrhizobium sp. Arg237L]|uniref:nucleotidyl transferase AbiEii/AbiGii toxin family protein n=1 Tax=Bradyrhizobium sp. Arg237L TaxID=3003352 RepID=UPI00249E8057|nr:nucleotidyl transferase AbiEii/AbiGii toxin family protein [Bradyrhizobium sp. Arg237L]MDI4237121.1 nucleotidyl transferase AbiEii/AbiGii toxin family protein [Bradyrhizobium sp. Arg237L]